MQQSTLSRLSMLTLAVATVFAVACSDDTNTVDPTAPAAAKGVVGSTSGTDSTGKPDTASTGKPDTSTTPVPTSTGPVASIRVTPKQATLPIGNYLTIGVNAFDANGALILGKRSTFRSSDAAIVAVVSDTGTVVAKALGTAKIYATVDGHTDSTTITVTPATTSPIPPTAPAVSSFNLTIEVGGAISGTDTSKNAPLAGAIVKLSRIGDVHGDTLSTTIDAGSATTDAHGLANFTSLPGGAYSVEIVPPSGSGFAGVKSGFAAPTSNNEVLAFVLRPKI